jgi:NAD(P)-dependent dehydrogenase (short-subunit alcohol dehydrogenase family)
MTAPPTPRTILITGAGRGIGRAIALDLAGSTAAALVLVSRSETCRQTAEACNATRPGCAKAIVWDISQAGAAREAVLREMESGAGPIGLVHAASTLGPAGPFVSNDMDAWWKAVEVNLAATVRLVHALLQRMVQEKDGRMVLFAGGGGGYGYPLFTSYAAAKVALVRFVETLAIELGPPGPTVTIIAPGANETDTLAEIRRAGAIIKTVVDISEPCRLVRRLLLEDARALHGRFIHVRDGWTPETAAAFGEAHWKLRRVE